jgi:hypothetical protein
MHETEAERDALAIVIISMAGMILCVVVAAAIGFCYLLGFLWENKMIVVLTVATFIGAYWWKNKRNIIRVKR